MTENETHTYTNEKNPFSEAPDIRQYSKTNDWVYDWIKTLLREKKPVEPETVLEALDPSEPIGEIKELLVEQKILEKSQFDKMLRVVRIRKQLGFYPNTVNELVEEKARRLNLRVQYSGDIWAHQNPTFEGQTITEEQREDPQIDSYCRITHSGHYRLDKLARDIYLESYNVGLKFSRDVIQFAVEQWLEKQQRQRLLELWQNVQYKKGKATSEVEDENGNYLPSTGPDQWDKLIRAIVDDEDEEYFEFYKAILQSFIWQVKRKILQKPVTDHLMPIITGPQRSGKSTFVKMLFEPLKEAVASTNFGQIEDDRSIDLWNNFILFIDEMGKVQKSDIEMIKNKITADDFALRPMRSNTQVKVWNYSTMIGTSNYTVAQLINDPTGLRRFAEIPTQKVFDKDVINNIDFYLLWQSVDENSSVNPISNFNNVLQDINEDKRNKSLVEQWLDLLYAEDKGFDWTYSNELYRQFREDFVEHYAPSSMAPGSQNFAKEMKRICDNESRIPLEYRRGKKGSMYRTNWSSDNLTGEDNIVEYPKKTNRVADQVYRNAAKTKKENKDEENK